MTNPGTYELLNLAQRAGAQAAEHIRQSRYGKDLEIQTKSSPTDMVTMVDKETEGIIKEMLLGARPQDGFLGEESAEVTSNEITWVVDPIDGTTNFVYGFPVFAVSIAARDFSGATLVGLVVDVYHGDCFYATLGGGSFLNNRSIAVSNTNSLSQALVSTGFSYDKVTRVAQAKTLTHIIGEVRDIRRAGAASLDLCYLAAGRVDGYYEVGLWPWDYAAGTLIVREAGGVVGSLNSDQPSQEITVAGNTTIFKELRELLLTDGPSA